MRRASSRVGGWAAEIGGGGVGEGLWPVLRVALRSALALAALLTLAACSAPGPNAPRGLALTPGPAVIVLAWQDASDDEDGFVIYRKSAPSAPALEDEAFARLTQVPADTSEYRDATVEPERFYQYAVAAVRGGRESQRSEHAGAVRPEPRQPELEVLVQGEGLGRVRSEPPGLACDERRCSGSFPEGSSLRLVAEPEPYSAFGGWGGACSGSGGAGECLLTLSENAQVTASFARSRYLLELSLAGPGTGGVRIVPPDVTCREDCVQDYGPGLIVSLLAVPDDGSRFLGWGGACSGNGLCELRLDEDRVVVAEFTLPPPVIETFRVEPATILAGDSTLLAWRVLGEGALELEISPGVGSVAPEGSVRVSPSGDTVYTLTARSAYGGDDATVEVEVEPSAELTVEVEGAGRVLSANPVNTIDCGAAGGDCLNRYALGTEVVLEADGASLTWDGCAPSAGSCRVTMDRDRTVRAVFR